MINLTNKDKLNNLITELRAVVEREPGWGFMLTGIGEKSIVNEKGEVQSTKGEATLVLTVGEDGKEISLKKGKGK